MCLRVHAYPGLLLYFRAVLTALVCGDQAPLRSAAEGAPSGACGEPSCAARIAHLADGHQYERRHRSHLPGASALSGACWDGMVRLRIVEGP